MYVGVLLVVGVFVWSRLIWPAATTAALTRAGAATGEEPSDVVQSGIPRAIGRFGKAVAWVLLPVWGLGLVVQVQGFRDPFVPLIDDVSFLLRQTVWGTVWVTQGVLVLSLALSAPMAPVERRSASGRRGTMMAVVGLVLSLSLSSHAMSVPGALRFIAVAADALHTLAAGTWMGALALIVTIGARRESHRGGVEVGSGGPLPAASTGGPSGAAISTLATQLQAFSPLALVAVPVLVVMGGTLSVFHLSTLSDLWATNYGKILVGKVAFVALALLLGFLNWRKGLPTLDSDVGRRVVRLRASWEVAVAGVVLLFTAVLTGTPSP